MENHVVALRISAICSSSLAMKGGGERQPIRNRLLAYQLLSSEITQSEMAERAQGRADYYALHALTFLKSGDRMERVIAGQDQYRTGV